MQHPLPNTNLWLHYWYATILPGLIALGLTLVSAFFWLINCPLTSLIFGVLAAALLFVYCIALLYWRFHKKGESDHWMVIKDGPSGAILLATEPTPLMVPRLRWNNQEVLAITVTEERFKVPLRAQLAYGPPPYSDEEIGHDFRNGVDLTEMSEAAINLFVKAEWKGINVNDPLNVSVAGAKPSVKVDVTPNNPPLLIQSQGLRRAAGQLTDRIEIALQAIVAGMSPAFLNANLDKISRELDKVMKAELRHRGLHVEDENGFGVTDHGAPASITSAVTRKGELVLAEKAKAATAEEAKKTRKSEAEALEIWAKAEAEATRVKAEAEGKAWEYRIKAMENAGVSPDNIALVLRQQQSKTFPILPEGVQQVILTPEPVSAYKSLDEMQKAAAGGGDKKPKKPEE